jgi:hypothetical protein
MENIKIGDIVYFKTGNIPMTVLRITPQRNGEPDLVYLVFTEKGIQIGNEFYITTLTKIKPN